MKTRVLAIVAFSVLAGTAFAEEDRIPLELETAKIVATSGSAEDVRREKDQTGEAFKGADLRKATVADVDLNGDGHVSFEELFRFDVEQDF